VFVNGITDSENNLPRDGDVRYFLGSREDYVNRSWKCMCAADNQDPSRGGFKSHDMRVEQEHIHEYAMDFPYSRQSVDWSFLRDVFARIPRYSS